MTHRNKNVGRYDLVTPMIPCQDELLAGIERILTTGNYILGEEVHALESEIAEACQVEDAIGVASGSSALELALQVSGVCPGSEVITTPYTFVATVEAIIRLGATPVLVDIKHDDLNIDPAAIEAAITDQTRLILPVHIFGMPCDMDEILDIADRHGLDIVEDMCQAFGSLYKGKPCGSFGRMSSLSFYPTKNLPSIGDAGMVLCRSKEDGERVRRLRCHQAVRINEHLIPGWNHRLDEIQALAIRIRLARFFDEQADRDRSATIYDHLIPAQYRLATPMAATGLRITHHQYWIRVPDRGRLMAELADAGIDSSVYYDPPLHRHELTEHCRMHAHLENADKAGSEILALPIHQALADVDAERIGNLVRHVLAGS